MAKFRGEIKLRSSRRTFLRNSTSAMFSWAAAPAQASFPSTLVFARETSPGVVEKKQAITIEIAAGGHGLQNSPVFFPLPEFWRKEQQFTLKRVDNREVVDTQVEQGPYPRLVWLIRDGMKPGETRRYSLGPQTAPAPALPVESSDDGRSLTISAAGRRVLRYNTTIVPAPNPQESIFERSGYLYPLFNPIGQSVTDDFPPDHVHQHSVWFAWSKAFFQGHEFNCWELDQGKGTIEHERFDEGGGGPVFAHFTALLNHVDMTVPEEPKTALHEFFKVLVYNLSDVFIFDVESTQMCATDSPVTVLENSYGGLAVRGHRNWFDVRNSDYLTSEGKTRNNGNQTRPRWVDLYGWVDGKVSGISVLDHPDNFRFPQPVRLHPQKPYFCFAPPALGPFSIEPGRPYRSRYRFYVHQGRPDREAIDRAWNDFAQPAHVRILEGG